MTARQEQLIRAEIARHEALALAAGEPLCADLHTEVAEALAAVLAAAKGDIPHG